MARRNELILKLCLVLLVPLARSSKLNVARILLPVFSDFSTNFTLQSTDQSCFVWTANKNDVINLSPIDYDRDRDCSSQTVVSVLTKESYRQATDIFAEDVVTHQLLRCVVIVDAIASLAITTTTRELVLEETPQVFEVRAYDSQGNEFSTLIGVPFNWVITPLGPNKDVPVLRFMLFGDSPYETPDTLGDMEMRNQRGHKVLLEGVKSGMSKVSVMLAQREYFQVKSNEIQLTVIANLMIIPREAYIMVGDKVSFKIIHTSYGNSEEIDLKSSQYYFDVEDRDIADTHEVRAEAVGLKQGLTKVILRDKNINENEPGIKLPSALLNVVKPSYMVLSLLPHKNWAALVSETHDIVAEVYSEDDHKILLGDGVKVQMEVADAFHIDERTANGTWQTGWTQREGTANVVAVLQSVAGKPMPTPLTATNDITIYPRIVLLPSEVFLPWDSIVKPRFDFDIIATGGDGKFLWSSTNHSVGVVTQYGKVHTSSHGFFEVSAAMHRNHHNRQTAKVHILPPARLEIVEYIMEAEINSVIFLHIALYAEKTKDPKSYIPFTKCQDLPFKVKMSDPKFVYNKELATSPVGISCGNIAVSSPKIGSSKITVSYTGEEGKVLSDTVSVTYFKPLKLLQPNKEIILAVGTSINLIFTGGPKATGSGHNKYLVSTNPDNVRAVETTNKHKMPSDEEYTVVSVSCLKLGVSDIVLSTNNSPNMPNCKNQEASATIVVICGKPRRIEMYPQLKVIDAKSCPMDLTSDTIVVQSNNDIDLVVKVKDDEGRTFLNISSLNFKWTMAPSGLSVMSKSEIYEKIEMVGTAAYPVLSYQKITPKVEAGEIIVSSSINGYVKDVLSAQKITSEWPEFLDEDEKNFVLAPLNSSVTLYLVDDTIVTPNKISIYNHPSNVHIVDVKQGSGYYQLAQSKEDVANVKYLAASRHLEITPISDGELTIKLIDLCLVSKPAIIMVNVVSVRFLRVEMSDKVEVGKCISCIVKMYDEYDNLLAIPETSIIEIDYDMEAGIAQIEKEQVDPKTPWNLGEVRYVITGTQLGDTKLRFSIGQPDTDGFVETAPMDLQVFPRLKLFPRNATIVVGSVMQYNTRGGPQPSPNLEYSVLNVETAEISNKGVIKGLAESQTKIKVKAVGVNPTNGQKILYGEDVVDVKVIKLSSIKLFTPLTRFLIGKTIPLYATGIPDQITPLVLSTIEPPIHFSWMVQDSNIAKISGHLDSSGIDPDATDLSTIRITGSSPGITTVHLNATHTVNKKTYKYTSTVVIEILDKLALMYSGYNKGHPLLMAPLSVLQLTTNLDNLCGIKYNLLGLIAASTDIQKSEYSLSTQPVTVSPSGLIKSSETVGNALIIVTATDFNGAKQTLTIPIEVKPVHYMVMLFVSSWAVVPRGLIGVIPLGTEFELQTLFYDNLGVQFSAANVDLQVATSRCDLTQIKRSSDNSTFTVLAKKSGVTGIKVWADSVEKTADYLKIHVDQVIKPFTDHITSGDVLCFKTPLKMDGEHGIWSVSDPNLMIIDQNSGVAIGTALKGGFVSVVHSSHPASSIQIRIEPIIDYLVEYQNITLSNAPEASYKVYFVLRSADSKATNNMVADGSCSHIKHFSFPSPIHCKLKFDNNIVSPDEVFTVSSQFDPLEGKHFCQLQAVPDSNRKYSTLTTKVLLTMSVVNLKPQQYNVAFAPAIYVPSEIILTEGFLSGKLVIHGLNSILQNVEVRPKDDSFVLITGRYVEGSTLTHTVTVIDLNKAIEEAPDVMSVIVISKSTHQHVSVMVRLEQPHKVEKCVRDDSLLSKLHANRNLLALIIVPAIVFFISLYIYTTYLQQPIMQQSLRIVSPSSFGNVSPAMTTFSDKILNTTQSSPLNRTGSCYGSSSPEVRRNRRYM